LLATARKLVDGLAFLHCELDPVIEKDQIETKPISHTRTYLHLATHFIDEVLWQYFSGGWRLLLNREYSWTFLECVWFYGYFDIEYFENVNTTKGPFIGRWCFRKGTVLINQQDVQFKANSSHVDDEEIHLISVVFSTQYQLEGNLF